MTAQSIATVSTPLAFPEIIVTAGSQLPYLSSGVFGQLRHSLSSVRSICSYSFFTSSSFLPNLLIDE